MNRVLAILLLICICSVQARAEEYKSDLYGYRIHIPETWLQIPKAEVPVDFETYDGEEGITASLTDEMFEPRDAIARFKDGFVKLEVVHLAPGAFDDEDEIRRYAEDVQGLVSLEDWSGMIPPDGKGLLDNIEVGVGRLDSKNRQLFLAIEMDVAGAGRVRIATMTYFGRGLFVRMSFAAPLRTWDELESDAAVIMSSFEFDDNTKFDSANSASVDTWLKHNSQLLIESCALLAVLGCVAFLVARHIRRGRQKT